VLKIKNSPLVSIGVPIYNVERYIERCAISLLRQTYDNVEVVFVDDCSPDNSVSLLKKLIDKEMWTRTRIVYHNVNLGVSAARNTALDAMVGDYVMWVDPDDWVEPDFVEACVQTALEDEADMVIFNSIAEYEDGSTTHRHQPEKIDSSREYSLQLIKKKVPYELWGRMTRRCLYTDNDIRCLPGVNIGEDFQVTTRLAYYANKVKSIPKFLYHYNCCNQQSLTKNGSLEQSWETIEYVNGFFSTRGEEFLIATKYMVLWSISCDFTSYGKYGKRENFSEARRRLKDIPVHDYRLLSITRRLILWLAPFPFLVYFYGRCASWVRYSTKRILKHSL